MQSPRWGSTNIKSSPHIFENEPGQAGRAEPAGKIVAAAPPADAEGARPQQAKSLLAELPPSRSFFERERSPTTPSGELDNVAPAVKTVAGAHPTHAVAMQPQQTRSLADLPALSFNQYKTFSPHIRGGFTAPLSLWSARQSGAGGKNRCSCPSDRRGKCAAAAGKPIAGRATCAYCDKAVGLYP